MHNNLFKHIVFIIFLATTGSHSCIAQETAAYYGENVDFDEAKDLMSKEMYSAAQQKFEQVIARINDDNNELQVNATYFAALCALELFNKDADYRLRTFISDYPESPKVRIAYFQLGKYHYRRKNWQKTIEWLEKVDPFDLSTVEVEEFHFKLGYSYFEQENYEKAKAHFYEIKESDGDYNIPATFYYAHIAYTEENYQAALENFLAVEDDEVFGKIAPYYIAQILYIQQKYADVITYAPRLLKESTSSRLPEIARIIGESHFKLKQYAEAIPYLEQYRKATLTKNRDDLYELGFAYYQSADFANAIHYFAKVVTKKDYQSQITYYHMADCYLKQDEKQYARNAFEAASKLDFDPEIQEDALFSYAKIAYELSYNPYDEAIRAFEDYIELYPNSKHVEEAYDYLLNVYLSTHNYKAAMQSLDKFGKLDIKLQQAYQIVAFNRGIEMYHNGQYPEAIDMFKKVALYPLDIELNTKAKYWIAECNYNLHDYPKSIIDYAEFMLESGAHNLPLYNIANYNMAYAYFKQKKYEAANIAFRKFTSQYQESDKRKLNDSYLRIGDCYFMQKDIEGAIENYDKAITLNMSGTDYAMYQKAYCLGLKGKDEEKIILLKKIVTNYPNSALLVSTYYNLASANRVLDNRNESLKYYQLLVDRYPNNEHVRRSLLEIAAIQFKLGKVEAAEDTYKRVVEQYPNTPEFSEALASLKDVMSSQGRADEYIAFASQYVNVSDVEKDSLVYLTAENIYFDKGCEQSEGAFQNYLNTYPHGIFSNNAFYYLADCRRQAGDYVSALGNYQELISRPENLWTEDALYWASAISYFEMKDYKQALGYYTSLEKVAGTSTRIMSATIGLMNCFYSLFNYEYAIIYANRVIEDGSAEEKVLIKAHFILGSASMELGDFNTGISELTYTAEKTHSEIGAEAKYDLAKIYFINGDYENSEAQIFELIQQKPSYDFWIANGYILLADNYLAMGDTFQAKHTLQSIIDNYKGSDLVAVAQDKLDAIIEAENKIQELKKEDAIDINIDENSKQYEKLFINNDTLNNKEPNIKKDNNSKENNQENE